MTELCVDADRRTYSRTSGRQGLREGTDRKEQQSELRVLRNTRHVVSHFGDESFQVIIAVALTKNSKQTRENAQKAKENLVWRNG